MRSRVAVKGGLCWKDSGSGDEERDGNRVMRRKGSPRRRCGDRTRAWPLGSRH